MRSYQIGNEVMKTESTTTITAAELTIGNKIINKYGDTFKVSDIEKNETCIWVQGFFQSKKVWVNDVRHYEPTDEITIVKP